MQSVHGVLERRWMTVSNSELWGDFGTYGAVPFGALPAIAAEGHDGSFAWLADVKADVKLGFETPYDVAARIDRLAFDAAPLNLALPNAFVTFMTTPRIHERVPTCTACYLDLSVKLIRRPDGGAGRLVRFMNDQQCCLLWYLLLLDGGDHVVAVAEPTWLDEELGSTLDDVAVPRELAICAASFEEFVHRFWLENALWYATNGGQPMDGELHAYAEVVRAQRRAGLCGVRRG
jgi:hypothetical protein